ncbi:MAG: DinB family protein [Ignavibacteriaceae bacterium]|jgi:uncharacterized damage-inducible protein DinB|nr:DinB family protein [Ignavibacteriaceae bacterium]
MFVEQFYSEFEIEFKGTRRVLENLDFSKFDYKPHPKSFSFRHLALHVANMPNWGFLTLNSNEYRMNPEEASLDRDNPLSKEELLESFDKNVNQFMEKLKGTTEEQMLEVWTLYFQDKALFGQPRHIVLRSSVMNHMIHHRAQLTVYLRMNDLKVPGLYGPSADDQKF